jgi:hypothetical protein
MGAIQQVLMAVGTSVFLPSSLIANPSGEGYSDEAASAAISLSLSTGGTLSLDYNASGTLQDPGFPVSEGYTWRVGGSSSLYSVRLRKTSGSSFNIGSAAVDQWLPINTDLTWNLISSSNSSQRFNQKALTGVLELAFTNNLTNILAQSDINFSTSASTQPGGIP